jgi:hypothetical protein
MPILATLRQDRAGEWTDLDQYLRDLRHRETGALAALARALSAPADEQKELAEHGEAGAILLEVACDLRVPKGTRLAASRTLLEAGIGEPFVGHLFVGAGDLVTDPRLGAMARKLVETGLPSALQIGGETAQITLEAGRFARAVHASASAVGVARIKELLGAAPELHAGTIAGLFALDLGDLPDGHKTGWKRLLEQTCAANRRAPAAAKRMGLAPPWPPAVPDAFGAMIREAEERSAASRSADAAAANPTALTQPTPTSPVGEPRERAADKPPVPAGRTIGPSIRRSPFRKSIGTVVEVPTTLPPKPTEELAARAPLVAPLPSRENDGLRFDARGQRVARPDRWNPEQFQWDTPVLPSSDLPPPPRVGVAAGRFASRVQAMLDGRPEAVDRFCAAVEARAAVGGEEDLLRELQAELSRKTWRETRLPGEQVQRLRRIVEGADQPYPWRAAARLLLDFFVSGGS